MDPVSTHVCHRGDTQRYKEKGGESRSDKAKQELQVISLCFLSFSLSLFARVADSCCKMKFLKWKAIQDLRMPEFWRRYFKRCMG
jgi:hypothetical protein